MMDSDLCKEPRLYGAKQRAYGNSRSIAGTVARDAVAPTFLTPTVLNYITSGSLRPRTQDFLRSFLLGATTAEMLTEHYFL